MALAPKDYAASSVFRPENLLREARRQKRLPTAPVPDICLLDPDGDIVRHLLRTGAARQDDTWPCYHTPLYVFSEAGERFGAIPCAVGAPFAVLIAEQLFASGCRLLISITSAGRIAPHLQPPCYVLIDRALRDEGTSLHYLPEGQFVPAPPSAAGIGKALQALEPTLQTGASWTTDAPFRETETAIAQAEAAGALVVEMEAAGLYAFANARHRDVLCFAHVTNQMAQIEGDFEKGEADGAISAIRLLRATAQIWRTEG